jgi:hypothetical protein
MRLGLQGRIIVPVMFVTGLAVGLSAFLNYGKFLRTFTELEASRFAFVAGDLKTVIEGGLDLGVSLRGMVTAQTVIEDEAQREPQIYGIIVFNDDGRILYRTGKTPFNTAIAVVPVGWVTALNGRDPNWTAVEGDVAVAGTRLSNDIRQTVGGVAVLYSRETRMQMLRVMAEKLAVAAVVAGLITVLINWLGVSILIRRARREIGQADAALKEGTGDTASTFDAARRMGDTALEEIAAVAGEVERLGGEVRR